MADEHERILDTIRTSIENRRQRGESWRMRFYFSAPKGDLESLFGDPNVQDVVETFQHIGIEPQVVDTVPHAANLNRDWWEAECDECVREYCFTLPVGDDLDALARMVEYEEEGKVLFIVNDLDD